MHRWSNGKQKSLEFGVWMVWKKPKARGNECYFSSYNIAGFNGRNKHYIHYPNVPSAIQPVLYGLGVPIPTPPAVLKDIEESDAEMSSSECQSADALEQCYSNTSMRALGCWYAVN